MENMTEFMDSVNSLSEIDFSSIVNSAKETAEKIKELTKGHNSYFDLLRDKETIAKIKELLNDHCDYEMEELRSLNKAYDLLLEIEDDEL